MASEPGEGCGRTTLLFHCGPLCNSIPGTVESGQEPRHVFTTGRKNQSQPLVVGAVRLLVHQQNQRQVRHHVRTGGRVATATDATKAGGSRPKGLHTSPTALFLDAHRIRREDLVRRRNAAVGLPNQIGRSGSPRNRLWDAERVGTPARLSRLRTPFHHLSLIVITISIYKCI